MDLSLLSYLSLQHMAAVDTLSEAVTSPPTPLHESDLTDEELPQCKIKRNYSCSACDFFSQNPRSFLYHCRDVHHDKIKIYECSQCLYASKHSQKLQRHINMIHVPGRETVRKPPVRKTPERVEPQPGPSQATPRTHKCTVCSFTSQSPALIKRHERVVHLKKRHMQCSKCSYSTPVKARFTKHVKYHSMPMIKCDLCDFRTPYKWNLDRHYKNHSGNGAFQCSKCNFRADIKQSLTVHEMNHHVPPVGAGAAILLRKKNKVGGSETVPSDEAHDEMELLRLEREDDEEESDDEEPDLNADPPGKLESALSRPLVPRPPPPTYAHDPPPTMFVHQCKLCDFSTPFEHEARHHERVVHPRDRRPPPNLIPLATPPLKVPAPREPVPLTEETFNELCKKSSLTKSLKNFVSLIGDEEALKSIPDTSEDELENMDDVNLVCDICGYESRSFGECMAHERMHAEEKEEIVSGEELKSTRCRHCRTRCKTSADLRNHLLICSAYRESQSRELTPEPSFLHEPNKVYMWNGQPKDEEYSGDEDYENGFEDGLEFPLEVQLETSEPSSPQPDLPPGMQRQQEQIPPHERGLTLKKVFKCPHCNFWASTASRFHVHIVGHLNKKPFECSLCSYRSNWRWDITKHIRLKSARDPSHTNAVVNMTDETGRRNYSKYNKYLTMMRVQEPNADSSGTGKRTRPCDATQGTVKDGDILQPISIPEPPKLTPAPQVPSTVQTALLPPLPPLHAAHMTGVCKKTLFKCKKCLYRNADKKKVLEHVRCHQDGGSKQPGDVAAEAADDTDGVDEGQENGECAEPTARITFKCGHCFHEANWRHLIVRHCRKDHNNDVKVIVCPREDSRGENQMPASSIADIEMEMADSEHFEDIKPPPTAEDLRGPFACDVCPFAAEAAGDLTAHKLNHVDRPGSIFKCTYCPFYVPSKIAVLEHIEVHGVDRLNYRRHPDTNQDPDLDSSELVKGTTEEMKRYQCRSCPYVSNSKNQFLYHKQFHRPRNAPYKCNYCNYNVTRRHLLHQHLRVHHALRTGAEDADISLVWVLRNGSYLKMFKCRWCPHVNIRRINIQEHEKMHKDRFKFNCTECSYTCNNPGVLSAHVKVHNGCFGEIRSVVDPSKSDEEQIQSLQSEELKKEPKEDVEETPESTYYQTKTVEENSKIDAAAKTISFCNKCPARFLFRKELRIHSRFHLIRLPFRCSFCSYTARQRPHLWAHFKVHSQEYQERTADLADTYMISPEFARPKTIMISKSSDEVLGPIWSVASPESETTDATEADKPKRKGKYACHRCPAKFFKPIALQFHQTLHGSTHQHKCKYCDYAVKTYGNLIKHQTMHEKAALAKPLPTLSRPPTPEKKPDPQFGFLMHGSPDFVYPMYFKNGKLKEKRYKCHKCPSAFEKRDQYRVHLSLHGSKQKYKCEKCDYSVKYYANYVQHMKKHKNSDEANQVKAPEVKREAEDSASTTRPSPPPPPPPPLTLIEKQTLMLTEKKRKQVKEDDKKMMYCELCPYMNLRKDCLDNHERRHYILSGIKYGYDCHHCDYSTTQPNFLREHTRVHFKPLQRPQPEAYMLAQGLEIILEDEDTNMLEVVFKDCEDGTFEPPVSDEEGEEDVDDNRKMYIDAISGEFVEEDEEGTKEEAEIGEEERRLEEDLIEMVEIQSQFSVAPAVEMPKIKRMRGKNWRCKKCPHAFGKRDQYVRHISLHGSQQRYSCDICDYSVKFYTNYVQHMRMHQTHQPDRVINIKQYVAGTDAKSPVPSPESEVDKLELVKPDETLCVDGEVDLEEIEEVEVEQGDADAEDSDSDVEIYQSHSPAVT